MAIQELTIHESNQSIESRVARSLGRLGYQQLSDICCEANGSTIVLKGQLGSFYLAQMAQTIAAKVPGVRRVVNQVKIELAPAG